MRAAVWHCWAMPRTRCGPTSRRARPWRSKTPGRWDGWWTRWQRNARVQTRSQRNGTIFHASGALRFARNAAMAVMGESLMDNPWLYSGPPDPLG
jgi:hypothetical protein